MKKLLISLLICANIMGCSGFLQMKPETSAVIIEHIEEAQSWLKLLDSFYNQLVEARKIPDNTTEATRALAIADEAARLIKSFCNGEYVGNPNARLNEVAGMVEGAKALLEKVQ